MRIFSIFLLIFLVSFDVCFGGVAPTTGYNELIGTPIVVWGESRNIVAKLHKKMGITILNRGNDPIELNYSADECYFRTLDGKKYVIELYDNSDAYYYCVFRSTLTT